MMDMLLSVAAMWVFIIVFWEWCWDTCGEVASGLIFVGVVIMKTRDALVLLNAWKSAKDAQRYRNHIH